MGIVFLGFKNNVVFLLFVLLIFALFTSNYLPAMLAFLLMFLAR